MRWGRRASTVVQIDPRPIEFERALNRLPEIFVGRKRRILRGVPLPSGCVSVEQPNAATSGNVGGIEKATNGAGGKTWRRERRRGTGKGSGTCEG